MDAPKFTRRSAEQTSQGFDSGGAKILSVIRESGTDNDWRQCREVSPALQGRVVDTDSLEYASKFNPAYIIEDDGIINVYPVPGSNPDAYKVFYVNTEPIDGSGNSLAYDDSTLGSFPNDKVRLVVLYASIKTLGKKLAHSSRQVKIGQFQASLGEYQADMQNELNEFNKEMSIYQTTVGEAMAELDIAGKKAQKDADLESQKEIQEYQLKLSRYQAEIGQYQAEVGTEVQDYAARYQWMSQQQGILMQEYMMAFAPTSKKEPNQ
jgi:hypothetical protein